MEATNRKKILIVEDDDTLRNILSGQLNRNFEITQAETGEKGLESIRAFKPDLVLLDLLLPGLTGFEVLEKVRKDADPEIAGTKVIVFSNLSSKEDIIKATALSVTGYFVKADTSIETLLQKINEAI